MKTRKEPRSAPAYPAPEVPQPQRAVSVTPPAAPATPSRPVDNTSAASAPTHEEIARAAYLRWRQHGGDPIVNWLAAERELKSRAAATR